MKNLKRKIAIACAAFGVLLFTNSVKAQTHISITNGGDYYLCAGSTYVLDINVSPGYCVNKSDWYYAGTEMGSSPPYNVNNLTIKGWSNSNYDDTIVCNFATATTTSVIVYYYDPILCHAGNQYYTTCTLHTYYAQINGMG